MENQTATIIRSKAEKQQLIEQWQRSGQNKKVFCEQNGIKYHAFIGWTHPRKKRTEKAADKNSAGFIPVEIKSPVPYVFAEVFFQNGRSVSFHRRVKADYLRALLR